MHVEANWAYMKAINVSTVRTVKLLLTSKTLILILFLVLYFFYLLFTSCFIVTISVLSTLLSYPIIPLLSYLYLIPLLHRLIL